MNKICVYAISKNEMKFAKEWLESMSEADYIVVLDTGSTDGTYEFFKDDPRVIAEQKVITPWRFDVARNSAMDLIPDDANILLSSDLDEKFEPGWADVLRKEWIEGKHERAIYKFAWSHLGDGSPGRIFQYDKIHSRDWIWKYPVHETLWHKERDSNLYDIKNTLNLFDKIYLHHYPDKTKSRGSYLPLLELRAEESPEDYYGKIYLAHEYNYRGYYEKSIKLLQSILDNYKERLTKVEEASCYLFMGDSYRALKKPYDAELAYCEAIVVDKTYREPYMRLGQLHLELKNYDVSIGYVKEGLKKSYRHYTWLERDITWSYEPYLILCQSCYYGGYKRDSILYAAKALSYDKTNETLQNNLDICIRLTDAEELL